MSHTHILLQRLRSAGLCGAHRPKITAEPSSCTLSLRGYIQKAARVGTAVLMWKCSDSGSVDERESQQATEGIHVIIFNI